MFVPYDFFWIAGVVLISAIVAAVVFYKKQKDKMLQIMAVAENDRLYSTAWFKSEVNKYEEQMEAARKWREENPGSHVSRIGPPDPNYAITLEKEMFAKCKYANNKEKIRDIMIEYVPKIIKSLMETRGFMYDVKNEDMTTYIAMVHKYRIPRVFKNIGD